MTTDTTTQGATTTPATPAAAKDAARVKRTPKAAPKAAPKGKGEKAAPKATASGKGAVYFLSFGRPKSGGLLQAHTHAFMEIYGMLQGKGAPILQTRRVIGDTAMNYHVANGRMVKKDGQVFLTASGKLHFSARVDSIDTAAVKAYKAAMQSGAVDGTYLKNKDGIVKIA